MRNQKILARLGTVAAMMLTGVSAAPGSAVAATPTAAVSLGDSYISGEAGRWQGNSINALASRDGTDRAFTGTGYDPSLAYVPPSDNNGCHRSNVAEIRSGALPVDERINIACSGAVTRNIFRATSGGVGQNGELPQADQLAAIARQVNVQLVVLSIGGNDLGFASIVSACLQAYATASAPCQPSQQSAIDAKFPVAMTNVGKAIDEIRAAMSSAGYAPSAYRFILQSYPSVIPRGSEIRVPEIDRNSRINIDGCPVYNSDATWARDFVGSQISSGLGSVAAGRGLQFLNLRDFLQGREICSVSTRLADPLHPPSATTSDWARFLNLSAVETQGQLQETFHPNAYAQQALGNCLGLIYQQLSSAACNNIPGSGTGGVALALAPGPMTPAGPTSTPAPTLSPPGVARASVSRVTATSSGARFTVSCTGAAGQLCQGTAKETTTERINARRKLTGLTSRAGHRRVTVGQVSYRLAAGQIATINLPLNRAGKRLERKFKRLPITLTVTLTAPNGRRATIATRHLILTAKRTHKPRRR